MALTNATPASVEVATSRVPITKTFISWGDPVTDPASSLGSFTPDLVLTEQHTRGATVTDHPVEEGVNVVDHVRPLPDRLSLEIFVSNSPINSPDAQRLPMTLDLPQPGQGGFLVGGTSALLEQGLQAIGLMKSFPLTMTYMVDQFPGDVDYVSYAYDLFTWMRDNAPLLTIGTPRATYQNMILEQVEMRRDAAVGTSANFTLTFRQIRVVASSVVDAPQPSIPRSAPSVSVGKKDPKPADGPKESDAIVLKDWLSNYLPKR